jgi:hypothetical protein
MADGYKALWVAEHLDQATGRWVPDLQFEHDITADQYPDPSTVVVNKNGDTVLVPIQKDPLINTATRRDLLPKLPVGAERWRFVLSGKSLGNKPNFALTIGDNVPKVKET